MFLSDGQYNRVLGLIDGKHKPFPWLAELQEWGKAEFGVEIYDYVCEQTVNNLTRLKIVVWDRKAADFFKKDNNYNPKIQKKFQEKFAQLARKYNVHPEYHDENHIFVCTDTISDQIESKTLWSLKDMICFLQRNDIWKIAIIFQSVHIFYETDEQIERHKVDGVSDSLRAQITNIVKPYDKYNVFPNGVSCVFTSKQTLDEKYSGSMFYYTR